MWLRACEIYDQIIDDSRADWDDFKVVVHLAGQSFNDLVAANHPPASAMPPLNHFITKVFPSVNWDLKAEDCNLFDAYGKFQDLFTDKNKHYNTQKAQTIADLDRTEWKEFMMTTKRLWLWYLDKLAKKEGKSFDLNYFSRDF